ncbi:MAG TPA: DUF4760 domain-containing protein [Candidatus Eremiobacteraceae bacterium]|nr:DUF4760 domain-containing protein [Candidatus Eremiobacteraceae bacterium]
MSLELLNASASLLTVCIIAATALAAMVQLRHLRAGNQINAMLAIGEELASKAIYDARYVVRHKLAAVVDDPEFRAYNARADRGEEQAVVPEYEEIRDAVTLLGNSYEELGILVKQGIVDKDIFLDRYSWVIVGTWKRIERALADARLSTGKDAIWENFEYLAVLSENWLRDHPTTYPRNTRRMVLPDRPPLPS